MSQVWSEINKVVNCDPPASQWSSTGATQGDIVDMENFKRCTFLIMTGATSTGVGTITVQAGTSNASCATDIVFKYRSVTSEDTYGDLTDATTAGFSLTVSTANQYHVVEVDAQTVAAGGTDYDHCAVTITGHGTAINGCFVGILSEPRYPQGTLATAIG